MWLDGLDQKVGQALGVLLQLLHSQGEQLINGGGEADHRHV